MVKMSIPIQIIDLHKATKVKTLKTKFAIITILIKTNQQLYCISNSLRPATMRIIEEIIRRKHTE